MTEKRPGPTKGVRLIEVSVKRELTVPIYTQNWIKRHHESKISLAQERHVASPLWFEPGLFDQSPLHYQQTNMLPTFPYTPFQC